MVQKTGLHGVLRALDEEFLFSVSDEEQMPLKRADFEFVLLTRLGYADKRTLDKYWAAMSKARICVGMNQYTVVIDRDLFRQLIGWRDERSRFAQGVEI